MSVPFSFLQDSLLLVDKLPTTDRSGYQFNGGKNKDFPLPYSVFQFMFEDNSTNAGRSVWKKSQWEITAFSIIL